MAQDVAEALRRLPDEVVLARNARLHRAMDLSLKGITLPKELQDKQTPFESYLQVIAAVAACCPEQMPCVLLTDGHLPLTPLLHALLDTPTCRCRTCLSLG